MAPELQSYRVTEPIIFFGEKKLQRNEVTGLQAALPRKNLGSRATELQSYRVTAPIIFVGEKKKLQRNKATGLQAAPPGKISAPELQSYRVTAPIIFFGDQKSRATKKRRNEATELQNCKSIHITCHIYSKFNRSLVLNILLTASTTIGRHTITHNTNALKVQLKIDPLKIPQSKHLGQKQRYAHRGTLTLQKYQNIARIAKLPYLMSEL